MEIQFLQFFTGILASLQFQQEGWRSHSSCDENWVYWGSEYWIPGEEAEKPTLFPRIDSSAVITRLAHSLIHKSSYVSSALKAKEKFVTNDSLWIILFKLLSLYQLSTKPVKVVEVLLESDVEGNLKNEIIQTISHKDKGKHIKKVWYNHKYGCDTSIIGRIYFYFRLDRFFFLLSSLKYVFALTWRVQHLDSILCSKPVESHLKLNLKRRKKMKLSFLLRKLK